MLGCGLGEDRFTFFSRPDQSMRFVAVENAGPRLPPRRGHRPAVRPSFGRDKETATAANRCIVDQAAANRVLVLGFHCPFPDLRRIW